MPPNGPTYHLNDFTIDPRRGRVDKVQEQQKESEWPWLYLHGGIQTGRLGGFLSDYGNIALVLLFSAFSIFRGQCFPSN